MSMTPSSFSWTRPMSMSPVTDSVEGTSMDQSRDRVEVMSMDKSRDSQSSPEASPPPADGEPLSIDSVFGQIFKLSNFLTPHTMSHSFLLWNPVTKKLQIWVEE